MSNHIEDINKMTYDEWQQRKKLKKTTKDAALGSGLTSAITGAGYGFFTKKNPHDVLALAAKSGLLGGLIGGGSVYAGSKILGLPQPEETTGYTRRGSLGGSVVGGGLGIGLGAGLGSGLIPRPRSTNLITKYIAQLVKKPGLQTAAKGAAILGPIGAITGGYLGNDEGLILDFIDQEKKQAMRKKMQQGFSNE
jgi:hypothetical protein